jgi:hypothetical protein
VFIGEFLQAFLQALAAPLAALRHDFTFDVGQTGQGFGMDFGIWFHQMTRLPGVWFLPAEEP